MKYLKSFNESTWNINSICIQYGIKRYSLNESGLLDVDGDVDLSNRNLIKIPLSFGKVKGYFDCCDNLLENLDGSPVEVNGSFDCSNNQLSSLKGCPEKVGGGFYCSVNKLTDLKGGPKSVNGDFNCNYNQIKSLEGIPNNIYDLSIVNNKIITLKYCPDINGEYDFWGNPVNIIHNLFNQSSKFIEKVNHIYTNLFIGNGWTIQGDMLEQIAEELDKSLPNDWRKKVENAGYKVI